MEERKTLFEEILSNIAVTEPGGMFARKNGSESVASYGTILVYEDKHSFYYFACRRRTTLEFAEMIKCGPRKAKLYEYLSNMTVRERELLCTRSHEELWHHLLPETGNLFPGGLEQTGIIFDYYYNDLPRLMNLTRSEVVEPPYEFPKGRPAQSDPSFLATALRELQEETGLKIGKSVTLAIDNTITDEYVGSDGVKYVTHYFVIQVEEIFQPEVLYFENFNLFGEYYISEDMSDYEWIPIRKKFVNSEQTTNLVPRLETVLFSIHALLCESP